MPSNPAVKPMRETIVLSCERYGSRGQRHSRSVSRLPTSRLRCGSSISGLNLGGVLPSNDTDMKSLLAILVSSFFLLTSSFAAPPLDLGAMVQPYDPAVSDYCDAGYYCWCPQINKGEDGKYCMVYSRWRDKVGNWLTASEVCLAVSDNPVGPYKHLKLLLQGRGPGHWDELMAHNPKIKKFGDKYYLYYISSKSGPTRGHIRDSQRTGVAVSTSLTGPYVPLDRPIAEPTPPVYNVAVNPTVEQMPGGRFLMMLKGDLVPKTPEVKVGQRVEGIALADKPTGPFRIQPKLAIKDINTEDADMWWDARRKKFFAVFHAYEYIGLIESADGLNWQPAEHGKPVEGNRLKKVDGTWLQTERGPLQRPSVFCENGEPRALSLAVPMKDKWYIVNVPLRKP